MKILGLDDYDIQARLAPALLAILPVALLAGVWTAEIWTAMSGIVTGLGAGGALAFLLVQVGRQAGKKVEVDLVRRLGGMPTTLALRHGGPEYNAITRARHHAFLGAKSGRRMPTAAEQANDPAGADACYDSCVDWLRKHAVDKKDQLVKAEVTFYGFRRNLLGLKPLALALLLACICLNALAVYNHFQQGYDLLSAGFFLEGGFLLILLPAWLLISPKFVDAAAWAYARRLLSLCEGETSDQ